MADNEVRMMMSVVPGTMTGFAAMNAGLVSINNVFGSMYRAFDQNFNLIDTALTTTSVVVAQLGSDAMNAFGQFEQGMKIVQMVSGQTAQEMQYLSQQANEFSVQYRTDIDQITEGLQTLGRAGLNSASEQAEVLENGLTTAKLEGRDLNSVLEELIQNTALLGGNLSDSSFGEQSEYVNDLLVATSMSAPITTHDVSETLKYSGGIAAAAGANIESAEGKAILEDYMGAIAAFAQKGVTGSIAGTALRAFFNKPATQDSSVVEALASIKLKPEYLWEDDEQTMKPISEQIKLITDQMDKLDVSTMDRLQIWSQIVGGKMGQQMMKLESSDIKNLKKEIQNADDATNLAADSMKTYEANIKAMSESGAQLQRNIGGNLVYIANPYLDFITKITEFLNQDFMAFPLTGGILAFVGYLSKKIKEIFSLVKSEITNLLSSRNMGIDYRIGKGGLQYTTDGSVNPEADLTKQRRNQPSKSSDNKNKGGQDNSQDNSNKMTPATFAKQLYKQDNITVGDLRGKGMSDNAIGVWQRLGGLKNDSSGLKIPDGQLVKILLEEGVLSSKEIDQIHQSLIGNRQSRAPFNKFFLEKEGEHLLLRQDIFDALKENRKARDRINEITKKNLNINDNKESKEKIKKTPKYEETVIQDFNKMTESISKSIEKEKELVIKTVPEIDKNVKKTTSEVTKDVQTTGPRIADITAQAGEKVVQEFDTMMSSICNISASASTTINSTTKENIKSSLPSYINPTDPTLLDGIDEYNNVIEEQLEGIRRDRDLLKKELGISEEFNELEWIVSNNDNESVTSFSKPFLLDPNFISGYIYNADGIAAPGVVYPDLYKVGPHLPGGDGLPYAGYHNSIPKQEEIEQSIEKNRIEEIKKSQEVAAAKQEEISKTQEEIASIQSDIDELELFAAELAQATEALSVLFPPDTGKRVKSASGIWAPGLTSEQKAERDAVKQRLDDRIAITQKDNPQKVLYLNDLMRFLDIDKINKELEEEVKKRSIDPYALGGSLYRPSRADIENRLDMMTDWNRYQSPEAVHRRLNVDKIVSQTGAHVITEKDFDVKAMWQEKIPVMLKDNMDNLLEETKTLKNSIINDNALGMNQAANAAFANLMVPKEKLPGFTEKLSNKIDKIRYFSFSDTSIGQAFSKRWNADRSGSLLNFGQGKIGSKLNGVLNMLDAVGGPWMAAMVAIPAILQYIQGIYEEYQQSVKDAIDNVQKAYSERNEAEDTLKAAYRDANPDITDDKLNEKIAQSYITLYDDLTNHHKKYIEKSSQAAATSEKYEYDKDKDDGSMKIKEEEIDSETKTQEELKKNTAALYTATSEINNTLTTLTTTMSDQNWGIDGWISETTDQLGYIQDHAFDIKGGEGTTFGENGGKFLLTASQQDENYSGYTEMAGLILEDFKDANGELLDGLKIMMGEDADFYNKIINKSGRSFMTSSANFASQILSPQQNMRLQSSMKEDSKTWKELGKEIAKYENKNKTSYDVNKKVTRIQGLINKLQSTLGAGFSETSVLQSAYLQIAQDMYSVAQTVFTPLIQQNAVSAAQSVAIQGQTYSEVDGTGGNTYNTAAIASSIAAMLGTIALAQAGDAARTQAMLGGDIDGVDGVTDTDRAIQNLALNTNSGDEFLREALKQSEGNSSLISAGNWLQSLPKDSIFYNLGKGVTGLGKSMDGDRSIADYLTQVYGMTTYMSVYGMDSESAQKEINKVINKAQKEGVSPLSVLRTLGKNWTNPAFVKQIEDSYILSQNDNSNSGSGKGSGSGSNNNNNTGTRKERVDLVLCNRKTIPKLNVNLFKKPPSFTILNKNFKLRDVKINSEDKPKAIMAAIKNSFIDIQKRTDPKIIQDENSVYDPLEATEGTNLPSGSSKTNTN